MVGIKFRVIENNKKVLDTTRIDIPFPKQMSSTERPEYFTDTYDALKKKYPKAEIIVICENIIWETYEPMSKLLHEDIIGLLKKVDKTMREGVLK